MVMLKEKTETPDLRELGGLKHPGPGAQCWRLEGTSGSRLCPCSVKYGLTLLMAVTGGDRIFGMIADLTLIHLVPGECRPKYSDAMADDLMAMIDDLAQHAEDIV